MATGHVESNGRQYGGPGWGWKTGSNLWRHQLEPNTRPNLVYQTSPESLSIQYDPELTEAVSSATGCITAVLDVDGDGLNDLLTSGSPQSVLYGAEAGGFDAVLNYPLNPAFPSEIRPQGALHVADIDGDGWLDILLGEGQCEGEANTLMYCSGRTSLVHQPNRLDPPPISQRQPLRAYAGPMGHADMVLFAGGGACSNADPNEPIFVQTGRDDQDYPLFDAQDISPEYSAYKQSASVSFVRSPWGAPWRH